MEKIVKITDKIRIAAHTMLAAATLTAIASLLLQSPRIAGGSAALVLFSFALYSEHKHLTKEDDLV